jgi:response regulator RpfG family c-di-GMP phosphodiesterase
VVTQVLIVEDSEDLVRMLQNFLVRKGCEVKACGDGASGRTELLTGFYDVCLLDMDIPILNGRQVLQDTQKTIDLDTSVVVMTGGDNLTSAVECMRMGAVDYLRKPFRLEELELVIEKAVRTRRLVLENRRYRQFLEEEVGRTTDELKKTYFDIVRAFSGSIGYRDPYTGGHSRRVSELAVQFGLKLGFSEKKLQEVRVGGMLHDLGKIGVDDQILRKPGKLTDLEFEAVRRHPEIGYEIIAGIESMKHIIPYVLCHHERYDGSGYPRGLKGEDIPIEGRIICLSDALDAMRSRRSYREELSIDRTLAEVIKYCGTQFDPGLVVIFHELWNSGSLKSILEGNAA